MKRFANVLLLSLFAGGCAEPLEFADWTIPVPAGTPVIEYPAVRAEERIGRIELVEDLAIGRGAVDPNEAFYLAWGVAVDTSGRIYVMDTGNHRVQVFGPEGTYLRTFGRQGQGPGEFQRARQITLAGDQVTVTDTISRKFSVWGLDGQHVRDYPFQEAHTPERTTSSGDGTLLQWFDVRQTDGTERTVIARSTLEGAEVARYAEFHAPEGVIEVRRGDVEMAFSVPSPIPSFAVDRSGTVYFTAGVEYQIHTVPAPGNGGWTLRAAFLPASFPEEWAEGYLKLVRSGVSDVTRSELGFPERLPAVADLRVDGHGHLYVFPYVPDRQLTAAGECCEPLNLESRPVDVYSAQGERLFSGMTRARRWTAALDDYVYQVMSEPDTDERIVVRSRLVEPFE